MYKLTAFFGWINLMAATIGVLQNDIKKVLAYSTVSQLGYMFLAVGVGAFGAGLAHLMTHAFFKALMFLGAGSVIHGMHHEQDMRKMGGLAKKMPITHLTFLAGWLAIIGLYPLSIILFGTVLAWEHRRYSSQQALKEEREMLRLFRRDLNSTPSKMLTQRSLPDIGRKFGGRDHTTVLHAVRKIEQLCETDSALAEDIELLRRMLEA